MRRKATVIVLLCGAVLGLAGPTHAAVIKPPLVRMIDTSTWSPPSPDPMGLAYNPSTKRLLVADSEVEEMTIWANVNFYETKLDGTIEVRSNLTGFTLEPTDVAYNPSNGRYYISDDVAYKIFEIIPGSDGKIGTSDDTIRSFGARPFNDPEGLGYGAGSLFVSDGAGARIWRIQPGGNGVFDGGGDDVITSFSVSGFGQTDPEDVHYDDVSGNLFVTSRKNTTVVETTLSGSLVNSYDLSGTGMKNGSGITIAPTSTNSSGRSLYIADRGVDNDSNPNENDGKIFEYALGAYTPVNKPPVVTNPGAQESFEGDSVTLQITATDPEGDPITYSATGLPPGLSIGSSSGRITGTIAVGASAGSPYNASVTASDATSGSTATFAWTVKDRVPPSTPTGFAASARTTGLFLDWNDSTEPDLAGYDVRRSFTGASGSFVKINPTLLTTSSFLDTSAPTGATTYYRILAVDRSGNVSDPLTGNALRPQISFVGSSKHNAKVSNLTINKPVGTAQDDLLVAVIGIRGTTTITTPSGWTKVTEHTSSGSTPLKQAVLAKKAGSAEPASYTFSISGSSVPMTGIVLAYRGATFPISIFGGQANSSSKSITAPSLTPAAPDSVLLALFGTATGTTIEPPADLLEQDETAITSTSNKITISAADSFVPAAPLGTRVATAGSSAVNVGQVLVLAPAAPPNFPPALTNPGSQTHFEGDAVGLQIAATDAEGDPITYSATGLPSGLAINSTTGYISGTIGTGASAASPYNVTVVAADARGSSSAVFSWTIKDTVAPASPSGNTVSQQTNGVAMDWADNTEPDLAGYNVYRSATGTAGSFAKLNSAALTASSFFDSTAVPGAASYYEITALDRSGNESAALGFVVTRSSIAFVGTASQNGKVTTLTISKPAGTAAGDVLLAVIGIRSSATISAPSGWTQHAPITSSGSTPLKQVVFSKQATSSEPSSYAFSVGSSSVATTGAIMVYRGAAFPVAAAAGQANSSSTSITSPAQSSTVGGAVQTGFFGTTVATTIAPPAGMTEHMETASTSSSSKVTISVADAITLSGPIAARIATAGSAGVNVGHVVLLNPTGAFPNQRPTVTSPGHQSSNEGDTVTLAISATDPESDPITFGASGLPAGLAINASTGVISGTISAGASSSSPFSVTVSASDAGGASTTTFNWTISPAGAPPPPSSTLDIPIAAGSDDAEESATGAMDLTSSDLELVQEATTQTVGLRFAGVNVPAGSMITAAWVQFQVDEVSTAATTLTIHGHAIDDAPTFTTAAFDISGRPRTVASATWTPATWPTVGAAGSDQRTSDLKAVLQQIVDRPGWTAGQAIALIFSGTGKRVAESFEGGPIDPTLHIEFGAASPPPPTNRRPTVTDPGSQSSQEGDTVSLQINANDPDGDAITYGATGLPTGLSINTSTGLISGTVASGAAGTYSVTATASDAGGSGSAAFTWTVTAPGGTPPSNQAPTVTNPGSQSSQEGATVSLQINANDPDGDTITYGATGLPAGLSINTSTGLISGTVASGAAGSYSVTVTASDAGGSGSASFTWNVAVATPPPTATTLERTVGAGSDDAEETQTGAVDLTSSDLELITDGSKIQTVGLRFPNMTIPAGATITAAWIQFQVDEATSVDTSLTLHGQASDDAITFAATAFNVTGRPRTAASVPWSPAPWPTVGAAGVDQRTPDIRAIIQEIVNRSGWVPGNGLAIFISGSGKRVAESFEGGTIDPTLHVEYTSPVSTSAPARASAATPWPSPSPAPSPVLWILPDGTLLSDPRTLAI